MLGQRLLEDAAGGLDGDLVDRLGAAAQEKVGRRQLPPGALAGRPQLEVELRALHAVAVTQLGRTGGPHARLGDRAIDVLIEHVHHRAALVVGQRDIDLRIVQGVVVLVAAAEGEEVDTGPAERPTDRGAGGADAVGGRLRGHPHRDAGEDDEAGHGDRGQDQCGAPRGEARRQRTGHHEAEHAPGVGEVVGAGVERGPAAREVQEPGRGQCDEQATHPEVGGGERLGVDDDPVLVGLRRTVASHEERPDEHE